MVVVGDRVLFKSSPGTVRFVGNTDFSGGIWCGVELDAAVGKNDGSVQGTHYFDCPPLCGIFVREPMLEPLEPLDRKKRRQTSTGVTRATSRAGIRSVSRASIAGSSTEEDEATRLKAIVAKLQDKLHLMHQEIESLKRHTSTLEEQRAHVFIKSSKLEEDLEMMSIDKETVEEQNELLRQEMSLLKQQNEALQIELNSLKEELQLTDDVDDPYKRNQMLELALLKLRDHVDQLQSQLEKALIDANKNNQLPKEIVEKLSAYESKIEELQELRREEEDLERIHMETELELQQEITALETIIKEKQSVITNLEQQNIDLSTHLNTLQKNNHKPLDSNKYQEYKITIANLQRELQSLQLDFKLLNLEVQMREKLLPSPPNHIAQLTKYSDVYRILGYSIETNEDVYLNTLAINFKFSLLQFSLILQFVSSINNSMELSNVESLTQEVIHCIKEQEFRNIPSLQPIKGDLLSNIDLSQTDHPNRLQLNHQSKQHILSLQITQEIISKINTNQVKNNLEQTPELTKLYQLVLKRIEWVTSLVERINEEVEQSNEISQYEIDPLSSHVQSFIDGVLEQLTRFDNISLIKCFNELINTLDTLPITSPQWTTNKIVTPIPISHDDKELNDQLESTQLNLNEQSLLLEESTSKIQVLQARLEHLHDTELLLKQTRSQIDSLQVNNSKLDLRVTQLLQENETIANELHKARNNNLLHNSQFESLLEQKKYTEKASLVSEIEVLQRTVRYYTSIATVDRSWLRKELKLFKPFDHTTQVDDLRKIGKDLQRAIKTSHHHIVHS